MWVSTCYFLSPWHAFNLYVGLRFHLLPPPPKFGQQTVHTFTAGEPKAPAPAPAPNGLRASSEPIASSAPSNVAQSITPGEPNTPQINSNAPSKNQTSALYNKTSSTGLPVLNISFHTSNEATPMLRGSVLYTRQRKHVENHPWIKSYFAHCIGYDNIVTIEMNSVLTLKMTWL